MRCSVEDNKGQKEIFKVAFKSVNRQRPISQIVSRHIPYTSPGHRKNVALIIHGAAQ